MWSSLLFGLEQPGLLDFDRQARAFKITDVHSKLPTTFLVTRACGVYTEGLAMLEFSNNIIDSQS
jgi:hypothetical protein